MLKISFVCDSCGKEYTQPYLGSVSAELPKELSDWVIVGRWHPESAYSHLLFCDLHTVKSETDMRDRTNQVIFVDGEVFHEDD